MQTATGEITTTWNGALSYKETGKPLLDFYYKVLRQTEKDKVHELLSKSWEIDPKSTFKLIFQLRDCRGGKGERRAFQWCIEWLIEHNMEKLIIANLKNIPEFGSFKDLVNLMDNDDDRFRNVISEIYNIWMDQLTIDLNDMNEGKSVSLAAKWFPKEGRSFDKKHHSAKKLADKMNISTRVLRKKFLVPLNKYLNTVEVKMCAREWESIKYNQVPSIAMKNLKKAFERHDPDGFTSFLSSVEKGETKINAGQLFPHQIVQGYYDSSTVDRTREAQWAELVSKATALSNCITMVDTSGSMTWSGKSSVRPIDVACALGLLTATVAKEPFNKLILTFSERPKFFEINKKTLLAQLKRIRSGPWGMTTNFQAAFDQILHRAVKNKVPRESMPKRIIVISDMQFDSAITRNEQLTNFDSVKYKYGQAGYDMPTLIFWNVNGSTSDTPVTINDKGAILISGFSQSVLKYLITKDDFGPDMVLRQILEDPRYNKLVWPDSINKKLF